MVTENKKNVVKMAMIYTQEGRWDKAIAEYKKLLTLDPTDFNTHNMLGDVYKKKNEDQLAYQEYIVAAEAYLKQGLSDKAQIIYKKIGALDSERLNDSDKKKQMLIKKLTEADKLIETGEIDKAIETFKEILKINPESSDTYQRLGELYAQKGNKEESLKYYEKIVDVYFKNRLYKKALPIYQKILDLQPENIDVRERIAEIYEREGSESDAKREYLSLAEFYWKMRNVERTEYFSQKAVDFKSIEAHYFKGAALYSKKIYDEAKKELDMLLKFKANHVGALVIMGNIYRDMDQTDEAIATFNKIIKAEEENTEAYEIIADLLGKKGLKKESAAKYLAAANIHVKKQELGEAVKVLNNVLMSDPDNIEVLQKLSDTLLQMNKKKEAADTYIRISDLYKKDNMDDKADEYYKRAEQTDPANEEIINRAKKLSGGGEIESVSAPRPEEIIYDQMPFSQVPDFMTAPGLKPSEQIPDFEVLPEPVSFNGDQTKDDLPSLVAMADNFIVSGSFDEGIELFQKALSIDPSNQEIKKKLNAAYSQYAGIPATSPEEDLKLKQEEDEDRKRREESAKQKQAEILSHMQEERKKKVEEEEQLRRDEELKKREEEETVRKKQQELMQKMAEERKKKEEEERLRVEAEHKKKEDEESGRKQREIEEENNRKAAEEVKRREAADAEAKRNEEARQKISAEAEAKKRDEELKQREGEAVQNPVIDTQAEETIDEGEIATGDFATVTTAEIFLKQGLTNEAAKILKRILDKDPDNLDARMKLDEIKKLKGNASQEKKDDDNNTGKGKQSRVSYI
jgi:tetratricopeptide (TPR) repeat protein